MLLLCDSAAGIWSRLWPATLPICACIDFVSWVVLVTTRVVLLVPKGAGLGESGAAGLLHLALGCRHVLGHPTAAGCQPQHLRVVRVVVRLGTA
jgi:hypothetical protein